MRLSFFIMVLWSAVSGWVMAAPTIPESNNTREPLMRALDTDGEVAVILTGEVAEKIRLQTRAPADTRVRAKVTTVNVIRPGCKRLHMELSEPTHLMKTIKGTEEPFVMWYELNLCRDGNPPQISTLGLNDAQILQRNGQGEHLK
jgi:hypothetical protein